MPKVRFKKKKKKRYIKGQNIKKLIKLKMLALKDNIKKRKRQDKAWEKIFKKYISDKGLAGRLYFFKKHYN